MSVIFKKVKRKNLRNPSEPDLYHPQLLTLGQTIDLDQMAFLIKEKSSLSKGDILSVLANLVEEMRVALYNGYSVNIRDFGVFSLSARTQGSALEKECTAKSIKAVRINFRPSSSVRPDPTSTRAGEKIDFVDLQTYLAKMAGEKNDGGSGGEGSGGEGGGDIVDPTA